MEPCVTLTYSQPMYIQALSILRTRGIWWAVFHRTLCNTGIFRTRCIFQTLSNISYREFYSESCVTLAYLKPWHIQNQKHIHNTVKHLSWNISFKFFCNPDIFRTLLFTTLVYSKKQASSEPYRISNMGQFIKNHM